MQRLLTVHLLSVLSGLFWAVLLPAQESSRNIVRDRPANQKWAVLIGVDEYAEARKLDYCGSDMTALKERLVAAGFPAGHVFLLHDGVKEKTSLPFKANIERQLELVLGRMNNGGRLVKAGLAGKGDLVVIGFSGHGLHLDGSSYLCPSEASLDRPETLLALDRLYQQLQACPADRKVLLVDACRNDPRPDGARDFRQDDEVKEFARSLEQPPRGVLVLTSCAVGERSWEDAQFGHGVFMHFLLAGLEGKADVRKQGRVSMLDLYQYASEETKTYVANQHRQVQRPTLRGEIEGDFALATCCPPAEPAGEIRQFTGYRGTVTGVCFSPDGRRLAGASQGSDEHQQEYGEVAVWDVPTGQQVLAIKGRLAPVLSVCFSTDGKRLAGACADGTVQVWDAQTGQRLRVIQGHTDRVLSVSFSPDGKRLVSSGWDPTVKVWDAWTGKLVYSLTGHTGAVYSVCFSPDGQRLASAGGEPYKPGEVKVWDVQSGQELLSLEGHKSYVNSVCFSPDGQRLVSASADRTVKVWDLQGGQPPLSVNAATGAVFSVCFSPDGKRLASAAGDWKILQDRAEPLPGEVKVWDAQTGQKVLFLKGHTNAVLQVCFSPDGRSLVSAGADNTLRLWRLPR